MMENTGNPILLPRVIELPIGKYERESLQKNEEREREEKNTDVY